LIIGDTLLTTRPTTNTFKVVGLKPLTTYNVRIFANDPTGNASDLSDLITVTTVKDVIKPLVPTGLAATNITPSGFTMSWLATTDNVGVVRYEVYRGLTMIGSTTSTQLNVNDLPSSALNAMAVLAVDEAGNKSTRSKFLIVKTLGDINPPTQPDDLLVSSIGLTGFYVSWNAATDDRGVNNYEVYLNGVTVGKTEETKFKVDKLTPNTEYQLTIKAIDNSGNKSASSVTVQINTKVDNLTPSEPSDLTAISISDNKYLLTWKPSTDNILVTRYQIFVEGVYVDVAFTPSYEMVAFESNRTYSVVVNAVDDAGNISVPSGKLTIGTKTQTQILAPTVNLITDAPITNDNSKLTVVVGTDCVLSLVALSEDKTQVKSFFVNRVSQRGEIKLSWNGRDDSSKQLPSGTYTYVLTAKGTGNTYRIINRAVRFDFIAPEVQNLKVSNNLNDTEGTSAIISYTLTKYAKMYLEIRNSNAATVFVLNDGNDLTAGNYSVTWNGKDQYFQLLTDGKYTVFAYAIDGAGKRSATVTTTIDIELYNPGIDEVKWKFTSFRNSMTLKNALNYTLSEKSVVSVKIYDLSDNLVKTIFQGTLPSGQQTIVWNGTNNVDKLIPVGVYTYKITATDLVGKEAEPAVGVLTVLP
jgi:hypothetical protein